MKPPIEKFEIQDGYYVLIIVQNGKVIHFTPNVSLSHADFVKRSVGTLPADAWVGSATKNDGYLAVLQLYKTPWWIESEHLDHRGNQRTMRTLTLLDK